MGMEIEIKLKITDRAEIAAQLLAGGATRRHMAKETNIFFDRPDRSLRHSDCGLRVRLEERQGESAPRVLLTYKGPRQISAMHHRESYDVQVQPPEEIIGLLTALGFVRTLSFEKRRESWQLEDCLIEVDELPRLGSFLEIEGPSEESVRRVQEKLGLGALSPVGATYIAMVDEMLRSSGLTDLRF